MRQRSLFEECHHNLSYFEQRPRLSYIEDLSAKAQWLNYLVFQESLDLWPRVFSTILGGTAFATGDLFPRHPADPELWRINGTRRKDEQIMHLNGGKTNLGPIGPKQDSPFG